MRIKTLFLFALVFFGAGLMLYAGGRQGGRVQHISIGTSSVGGAFSVIGTAMADVVNRNIDGVHANIEITGGSSENILLVERDVMEFGMAASDVMYLAMNGLGTFEGNTVRNVRGVMGGHLTTFQVYVLAESNIYTFHDLRGRRISLGPPGSVGIDAMVMVMRAHGYEMNRDWTPEFLSHGDGAQALTDRNVDAVVLMSTVPNSPMNTAAVQRPIRVLDLAPEIQRRILADHPFYVPATVPANTYPGQTAAVNNTFAAAAIMVTNASVSEDLVYNFVRTLHENIDVLTRAFPWAEEWNANNTIRGLEGIVEIHPGTLRYLRSLGR